MDDRQEMVIVGVDPANEDVEALPVLRVRRHPLVAHAVEALDAKLVEVRPAAAAAAAGAPTQLGPEPIAEWNGVEVRTSTRDRHGWNVALGDRKVVIDAPEGFDREHFEPSVYEGLRRAGSRASAAYTDPPHAGRFFAYFEGTDERSNERLICDVRREVGRVIDFDRRVLSALKIVGERRAEVMTREVVDELERTGYGTDYASFTMRGEPVYEVEQALRRVTKQTGPAGVWRAAPSPTLFAIYDVDGRVVEGPAPREAMARSFDVLANREGIGFLALREYAGESLA